jgi:hypothetical protein
VPVTTRGILHGFWLDARGMRLDVVLVAVATTYVTVSTSDVRFGRVPLKLFVVGLALVVWVASAKPWRHARAFSFRWPVLVVAVAVPIVWLGLAALRAHGHDPAQRAGLSNAAQEASRFIYLLLYFPLADYVWLRGGWSRLWRLPVLVLCAVSVGLLLGHVAGANYGWSGTVGPLQGQIGVDSTGTFRTFMVSDVLLIPLAAFLAAEVVSGRLSGSLLAQIGLVLICGYLAHSRGLWLGLMAVVATLLLAAVPPKPRLVRAAAWMTAGAVALTALLISADPNLSRAVVRWVTASQESSTAQRLAQAPRLLHAWARHPALGSGLGALLPSGYARDPQAPWSFELTYLQLLFETGVVGLALICAPAVAGFVRISAVLRGKALSERPLAFATVGALAALMITAAGNPYLLTSAGTYALAILLAIISRELATPGATIHTPQRAVAQAAVAAETETAKWRRFVVPAVASGLAAAVAALTLSEFTRAHWQPPSAQMTMRAGHAGWLRIAPSAWFRRLVVDRTTARLLADPLVLDSATAGSQLGGGSEVIWALAELRGTLRATPLLLAGRTLTAGVPVALGPAPVSGSDVSYAVARWGSAGEALFEMARFARGVRVRIISLSHSGRVLDSVRVALPPLPKGAHRDVTIGPSGHARPDLVVVDRGLPGRVMTVRSYPGESASPGPSLTATTSQGVGFPASRWQLGVGAAQSTGADLVLIGSGSPLADAPLEVHVLLAGSGYRAFGAQTELGLPVSDGRRLRFLVGRPRQGGLLLLVIKPAARTAAELLYQ